MLVTLDIEMTYIYPRRHLPCTREEFTIQVLKSLIVFLEQ